MIILGIETSCDETAAAVVADGGRVLSSLVYSQIPDHRPYGGVVPEIASRCHVELLPGMIEQAVAEAGVSWHDLDAIAVTRGPGLASSLLVGLASAKALGVRLDKPVIGVNHLEAHLGSIFLGEDAPSPAEACPLIALLVSGGHSCLVRVDGRDAFRLLGQTLDDAAGEALDKGASLLKLGYPGGPAIEAAARDGDPAFVTFPRGLRQPRGRPAGGGDRSLCFSFSGVKTALRYYVKDHPALFSDGSLKHVAASYQEAIFDALIERLKKALRREGLVRFACVGGVARNQRLRARLAALAKQCGGRLWAAAPQYCTDNAAMVAALAAGRSGPAPDSGLDLDVDPNLPIGG